MRILAIGAHPDDIEEGCSGYLIKKLAMGSEVGHLLITDGSMRGDKTMRLKEQTDALKLLKPSSSFELGIQDCYTDGIIQELIIKIESVVEKWKPDMILTHFPYDTHHDHRIISQASLEAGRYIPTILFYESASTRNFDPTHYCDITDVIDKKIKIMKCFKSQQDVIGISDGKAVITLAEYRGYQSKLRFKYAEAFKAYRDVL